MAQLRLLKQPRVAKWITLSVVLCSVKQPRLRSMSTICIIGRRIGSCF